MVGRRTLLATAGAASAMGILAQASGVLGTANAAAADSFPSTTGPSVRLQPQSRWTPGAASVGVATLHLAADDTTPAWLRDIVINGVTWKLSSPTTAIAGSTTATITTTGLHWEQSLTTYGLEAGTQGTITLTGIGPAPTKVIAAPITIRLYFDLTREFAGNLTVAGFSSMATTTVTAEATRIWTAFTNFDAYLDTLRHADGTWWTNHPSVSGPGQDPMAIGCLIKLYLAAHDLNPTGPWAAKATDALTQLLAVQLPSGGWTQPWPSKYGSYSYGTDRAHLVMSGFAVAGLVEAHTRTPTSATTAALSQAASFFRGEGELTLLALTPGRSTLSTFPIDIQIPVYGVTAPWYEVYNAEATALHAMALIDATIPSSGLGPVMDKIVANHQYRQARDGGFPYAWRYPDTTVGNTAPYNFVQARDFAEYHALRPTTAGASILEAQIGYLINRSPTNPILVRSLATAGNLDMSTVWATWTRAWAASQLADGSFMKPACATGATCDPALRDDHGAIYNNAGLLDMLVWAGWTI